MPFLSTGGLGISARPLPWHCYPQERRLGGKLNVSLTCVPPSWVVRGQEALSFGRRVGRHGDDSLGEEEGPGGHGCVFNDPKATFLKRKKLTCRILSW